ncbi:RlpA-like double-psi beta-barrel domain-containing protein [Deinococcus sp.]|uniref:RlpA-like double-psi beta-barrel domain-containing protein n=1 Tax=Deinococcus sp. TaxID=47478 RepID=UPI0028699838|nr:RlpA-like double-psi beta-barrel domain-containing protein [Deinococcus sp.]
MSALVVLSGMSGAERVYRVQRGDTLWSLSRANGTSVQTLRDLNPRVGSTLRVDAVILLPDRARPEPQSTATAATDNVLLAVNVQVGQAVYYPGRPDTRTPLTAAHLTLPKGTWVRVTHRATGRSVDVLINDRGPFGVPSRIIDLSVDAAARLGILNEGVAPVTVWVLPRP